MADDSFFQPRPDNDASAAFRGFVYQVNLTLLRWIRLKAPQYLELERGEDIDLVTQAFFSDSADAEGRTEQIENRLRELN